MPAFEHVDLAFITPSRGAKLLDGDCEDKFATQYPLQESVQDVVARLARLERYVGIVSVEPSLKPLDDFGPSLSALRIAFSQLEENFSSLLPRINAHTDACVALRQLRTAAKSRRNQFFFALVTLHDSLRAVAPESMTTVMAKALRVNAAFIDPGMGDDNLLNLKKALHRTGLSPYARCRKSPTSKKAAP